MPAAGEEGLDVIFMEAVALQHSVELLKILNVTLERHLLLPATCSAHKHTHFQRAPRAQHSTLVFIDSLISISHKQLPQQHQGVMLLVHLALSSSHCGNDLLC